MKTARRGTSTVDCDLAVHGINSTNDCKGLGASSGILLTCSGRLNSTVDLSFHGHVEARSTLPRSPGQCVEAGLETGIEAGLETGLDSPVQLLPMFAHMEAWPRPSRGRPRDRPRLSHAAPANVWRAPTSGRGRVEAGLETGIDSPMQTLAVFGAHRGLVEAGLETGLDSPIQSLLVFGAWSRPSRGRPRDRPRLSHTAPASVRHESRPQPTRNYILLLMESDSASTCDHTAASSIEF